jgi:hypothetical protein
MAFIPKYSEDYRLLLSTSAFVDFLINFGDFSNPNLAFFMLHIQDIVHCPVEMISDIRYLLIQLIQGVA